MNGILARTAFAIRCPPVEIGLDNEVPAVSRLRWFIVAEIGLLLLIGLFTYPSGDDFFDHFLPMARGCVTCGYNPYFTSWFLYPLSWLPWKANYLVWTALTLAAFVAAARYFAADPIRVILSFPMTWTLWLGQIDALPLAGLVMGDYALRRRRPLLLGPALVLMATKPQLSLAVMVLYLLHTTSLLRALLVPAVVAILSFLVWGLDWPLQWLAHRPDFDYTPWLASLWPWGLVAFIPAVLVPSGISERRKMLLYASAIGLPFFGSYSYTLFLIQGAPWWSIVATYIPILLVLFFGAETARLMVLVPIALLITETLAARCKGSESLLGDGNGPARARSWPPA